MNLTMIQILGLLGVGVSAIALLTSILMVLGTIK